MVENKIHGFGGPEWHAQRIILPDAPDEELTMWVRDIEYGADILVGRPDLAGNITFTPQIIYDSNDKIQVITQMPTGRRWHQILVCENLTIVLS